MAQRPFQSLLLVCEGNAATQQISFAKPLKSRAVLEVVTSANVEQWIAQNTRKPSIDFVVVSRDTTHAGEMITNWAHRHDLPVVYHIDDDLIEVPKSLGSSKFKHYSDPERVAQLRRNMDTADLVYASTPALAERLSQHGITSPIKSGNIYCSISPDSIQRPFPATGPVFGYMGTAGHAEDLAEILPAITRVLTALPTSEFEVFGTIALPEELQVFGPRVRHHAGLPDYQAFLDKMHQMGWWVGLAPIADNPFNRCKADTKWVEYTLAGTAVVAADLPVYHRACADGAGILAKSLDDWSDAILTLLTCPAQRQAHVLAAHSKLACDYTDMSLYTQVQDVYEQARTLRVTA
jgi:hypothetical protein